ncbi:MAG: cobalamin biosynthesis protein CobW, partial [Clostridia bacterium]|nr:cobalamin biosynthesis protein CobW [Clostridia bacterium]
MTRIDIISGFLGAGKTTLIKHLIPTVYSGKKLVLIENEFGEIGIDGTFLQDAGIQVTEMNSGCICCSLVGDFSRALKEVQTTYTPDVILIEPSGVGKLSDVLQAVEKADLEDAEIGALAVVVDAKKCKMYLKNFGEFFLDQVKTAKTIIFSHTDVASAEKTEEALHLVRHENADAVTVTTPVAQLSAEELVLALAGKGKVEDFVAETSHHHHHGEKCHCHDHEHHHHHDEECHCHEHEHHHHDEECHCHDHEHHHHDEECHCHEHGHHHQHADEVFGSWGQETEVKFSADLLRTMLEQLEDEERFGLVLRAKGIVDGGE